MYMLGIPTKALVLTQQKIFYLISDLRPKFYSEINVEGNTISTFDDKVGSC